MEFERILSRREAETIILSLRRAWVARSPQHLEAHERAIFILVTRSAEDRSDRLGVNDTIELDSSPEDADLTMGLLERATRFTRVSFLGVAPCSAVIARDNRLWLPLAALGEPRPIEAFELRAPRSLTFLARLDLREEARRALTQNGSIRPDIAQLRLYLLVFCFHDDDERYAAVRASVADELHAHLDRLRELCFETQLELGPEMMKLRDELRRETS